LHPVKKSDQPKIQRFVNTRGKDNPREKAFRSSLHAAGLRFRIHLRALPSRRTIDVAFPKQKVAIFLDGCFWHGCPDHGTWPKSNAAFWREKIEGNIARDAEFTNALMERGWLVLRVWEHTPMEEAIARTFATMRDRRRRLS
jgi:DNA mismatch endonuclease (patch repair protein)